MKKYFLLILFFGPAAIFAQKYILLDKAMYLPVSYANTVTITDEYKNFFAVEKIKINEFLKALDKVALNMANKNMPEAFDFYVGATRFFGIKVDLPKEHRLDVVLTTDCDGRKLRMHLSDGQVSNESNLFFIKTWAGYIRQNIKK